ncbi:MAG TPA: RNA polymerase sigma-70 factor [Arachidicoccus sp.]|nr:RNA polymerase sigma-70 factor [Arachidicoccus sp.]
MSSKLIYTDEQLVVLLKEGEEFAFTAIYERYVDVLYRYAWNILQNETECKDAIQEVFVWLWTRRSQLNVTALKYYLLAAVKYKLIRAIQNSKRRDQILARHIDLICPDALEAIEIKELKAIIEQFTQTLPPRAREIFHLSRNEYFTNREIASKLQISEKTVENQMTITLRKLRDALGNLSFWACLL